MSTATDVDALTLRKPRNEKLRAAGLVVMGFGVLSLVTALFFTRQSGPPVTQTLPPEGGTIGPIEVTRANTVLLIKVKQHLKKEGWSYIEGEVLDAEQETLFSFGDELWFETGYDSDGAWSEHDTDYDLKVTIPEKGTHYLAFTAETGLQGRTFPTPADQVAHDMVVRVEPRTGSAVPFVAAGIIGLILGVILHEMATGAIMRGLAALAEE